MSEKQLKGLEKEKLQLEEELKTCNDAITRSQACTRLYGYMNASEIEGGAPEYFTLPLDVPNPYHQPVGTGGGCCNIS